MSWLVKTRRNGGGESVLTTRPTRVEAQEVADEENAHIQSDNHYVEEYDPTKSEWPTHFRARAFLTKRAEMRDT